jgi:hypothetical protein
MRLGKSASVGQKRLDGGDGCSQGGYNQLQHRVWRVRVRPSLGALLPRPNRSELLNYFVLEFVQGFRAGHNETSHDEKMRRHPLVLTGELAPFALVLLIKLPLGCHPSKTATSVEGNVISNSKVVASAIGPGVPNSVPAGYIAVPNVRVYLAQANDCDTPIQGFDVLTDKNGYYRFDLANLPPPTDKARCYCIVAEKDGYEKLIQDKLVVGVFSRLTQNMIILKADNTRPPKME